MVQTDKFRGVIGPLLVSRGFAFGLPASSDSAWPGYVSYSSLAENFTTVDHPSPRYWLLWPGILCLVAVSMTGKACRRLVELTGCSYITTELACQWRIFGLSTQAIWKAARRYFASKKGLGTRDAGEYSSLSKKEKLVEDPASESDQVKMWMWLPGLISVLVLTCLVMYVQYEMPVAETCLALLLTFFFSFLAIQATGATGKLSPIPRYFHFL